MVEYTIFFTKKANKDKILLKNANLDKNAIELLNILQNNPYETNPSYEKLKGNLSGLYSRRINIQHRLVYKINEEEKEIFILAMWSHYDNIK